MSLLSLCDVTAFYGASQALHGVTLSVEEGEVRALMGRNGMGKTTTVKVICRMLREASGDVRFGGQALAGIPSHRAARMGLGLVPEGRRIFGNMSVAENLIAAARPGTWTQARVETLFPRLGERAGQSAATLSGGEQQMLAIGRALMTNPRLLILDEATEGLAPTVRADIWAAIRALAETGLSILVIDKSIKELATVARSATVLDRGRTVWEGGFGELTPELTHRYLGV
ncbi:MAG: ABC transporter ATP-binding protein [Pseudomonadota bacterium]